ncbi:tetratricopeptide (TPR) repeat protein [Granulicella aggregans]|uniref:Tetratricopeptide (TPR) repeat protein n=1 Tax=Granulicella aggregans TaxID=474949 RepID=A0A7W8E6H5_9BACT|nr:tetratricopeptide repeat protein [Granulicella aggregans]MBB5060691.1 tetratricopeptide (TPR) repeat protein [Granulicella aggregans]
MIPSHLRIWLLCLLYACSIVRATAQLVSLSGTVRDTDGHALPDATLSLSGRSPQQVSSDSSGHFHFALLAPAEYSLSAVLAGYAASGAQSIHLQSTPVNAEVVLSRVSANTLEFQSSGIHGLIDPGGYSASTASASSGVLRGIAALKRTDHSFAPSVKDWPCDLEPQLRQAAAAHRDQPVSSLRLGQFYVAHDQPALAIAPLQHALELDTTSNLASRALASAWLEAGNFDEARKGLNRALAAHESPELYELEARADEGSGLFQKAAEDYRRAAALSATEENAFGVGYELLLSGALVDASEAFAEGLLLYPKSILMQIGAGTAHFLRGDSAAALSDFLAAAETDPADHRPYSFLSASNAISSNQQDRALTAFKRYLDREPNSADANYFYAVALARDHSASDTTRTQTFLRRAIELNPGLAKAHLQLAESYAQNGKFEDAVPEYQATIRLDPDPGPHYRLALAFKHLGRADEYARDMQLFRQSRQTNGHPDATLGIDLAQFMSGMDTADSHLSPAPPCPTFPR